MLFCLKCQYQAAVHANHLETATLLKHFLTTGSTEDMNIQAYYREVYADILADKALTSDALKLIDAAGKGAPWAMTQAMKVGCPSQARNTKTTRPSTAGTSAPAMKRA